MTISRSLVDTTDHPQEVHSATCALIDGAPGASSS